MSIESEAMKWLYSLRDEEPPKGWMSVSQLEEKFGGSKDTIRRKLNKLSKEGKMKFKDCRIRGHITRFYEVK